MAMEMIVGRKGTQKIAITDTTVSREHCKLTRNADGSYTLENLSANGTYVDGKSIIRTVVTPDTVIMLGSNYSVRVGDLVSEEKESVSKKNPVQDKKPSSSVSASSKSVDEEESRRYREQFQRLRTVYDKYYEAKIAIQRESALKNFYRSLPTAITTILFALSMCMGEVDWLVQIRPFAGVLMIAFIGLTTFQVYNGQKEMPAKMEALNRQFMIDYVCPKCGNFLGYIPFEALMNKKQCGYCKCQWV